MRTTTFDGLLNHRITIEQPRKGFRVAVDTLLLAAAVPAKAEDHVLDLGCGVGGALLALACRVPDVRVTGIEVQENLFCLCQKNIDRNFPKSSHKVLMGDVTQLPDSVNARFDHVMMNPPYHDESRHPGSSHAGKRKANTEALGDLGAWLMSAAQALKPDGTLTLIHRADRMEEIIALLKEDFGVVHIKPVVTKPGTAPKRALVRATRGGEHALVLLTPLVLHEEEGAFTQEAGAILRNGAAVIYD